MAKKYIITILLLIFYKICFCQLETSVWYFGNYAGLDFKSKNPTILTDGKLKNFEGVATFSDSLGNLLFYTDGQTIWNKKHQIMDNGTDLIGDTSSTESAIIVPWPQNENKYYVFVVDAEGKDGGLSYSIVDMSANDGLGKVTNEKSIKLEDCVSEKVTAIRHENNEDYWILSRLGHGQGIVEYKITKDGLDFSSRKVFNVSVLDLDLNKDDITPYCAVGYMRVSPNGKKIACATGGFWKIGDDIFINFLEVFNFNPSTGEISLDFYHLDDQQNIYGVEFSNDCSKLYYSTLYYIYQFDLSAGTTDDIKKSLVQIGEISHPSIFEKAGALQLAINGKIYVAQDKNEYLGVINNPREKGEACNFDNQGQYLGGKLSRMGLPNFIPSYFLPPNFEIKNNCINTETEFICTEKRKIDNYEWKLYNKKGELLTQNTNSKFSYKISEPGIYKILLTIKKGVNESSEYRFFQIFDNPKITLYNDTIICKGDSAKITANIPQNCSFSWNINSKDSTIFISKSEELKLTITNLYTGCYNYATKKITVVEPTKFSLGNDTLFCFGDTIRLQNKLDFNYNKFTWLDNNKSALNREIKEPGSYIARLIDNNNCYFYDTINIKRISLPKIDFKTDEVFCRDSIKVLDCNVSNSKYLWSTKDTTQTIIVTNADKYSVLVTDKYGCQSKDSIELKEYHKSEFKLPQDTLHCDDQPLILHAEWPDATDYIWQDHSHNQDFEVKNSGTFIIDVVNICGSSIDSINVTLKYCGEFIFPNIITPNNDGINDYFKIKGLEWTSGWQIKIFNRNGNEVYKSNDYKNDWNAEGLNDGVYFYILSKNGQKYSGNVSVYRI